MMMMMMMMVSISAVLGGSNIGMVA